MVEKKGSASPFFPAAATYCIPIPYQQALGRLKKVLVEEGFELRDSINLSELVRERVGVELTPAMVMLLVHPVLAFQTLLAGEQAGHLLSLQLTVRALPGDRTEVSFGMLSSRASPSGALAAFLAEEARSRFKHAIERLRTSPGQSSSALDPGPKEGGR